MKFIPKFIFASVCFIAATSMSTGCSGVDRSEKGAAEEAEMEAAFMQGRTVAREFVNRDWKDTFELQGQLLEAAEVRGKYLDKHPDILAAYDSAFISTVRAVRPDMAAEIEKGINNGKK